MARQPENVTPPGKRWSGRLFAARAGKIIAGAVGVGVIVAVVYAALQLPFFQTNPSQSPGDNNPRIGFVEPNAQVNPLDTLEQTTPDAAGSGDGGPDDPPEQLPTFQSTTGATVTVTSAPPPEITRRITATPTPTEEPTVTPSPAPTETPTATPEPTETPVFSWGDPPSKLHAGDLSLFTTNEDGGQLSLVLRQQNQTRETPEISRTAVLNLITPGDYEGAICAIQVSDASKYSPAIIRFDFVGSVTVTQVTKNGMRYTGVLSLRIPDPPSGYDPEKGYLVRYSIPDPSGVDVTYLLIVLVK